MKIANTTVPQPKNGLTEITAQQQTAIKKPKQQAVVDEIQQLTGLQQQQLIIQNQQQAFIPQNQELTNLDILA